MQAIGATTLNEYRKNIEKDAALERRFQPIVVGAPDVNDSIEILKGLRDKYEAFHRIQITDEAIMAAVRLSDRYITDRNLPDKAIDLMDEACSRVRLQSYKISLPQREIEQQLEKVRIEKEIGYYYSKCMNVLLNCVTQNASCRNSLMVSVSRSAVDQAVN